MVGGKLEGPGGGSLSNGHDIVGVAVCARSGILVAVDKVLLVGASSPPSAAQLAEGQNEVAPSRDGRVVAASEMLANVQADAV